ncbi:hypothetical protein NW752_000187 [Fusarium irregulare]|uniref:C2H2-type domain-containing protein n=1 Tax=Fusarium irregulare TaxID=2494466 RepID=A0A9W8UFL1_9HYPO|nr:hypothetical protein NW766_001649 [Fusarium irregulare]KAJ4027937.1 hypothetical protein NW752_000187 [Fusarium irregulare]
MHRLSLEEERRDDETRRLARREEKKKAKDVPEQAFEPVISKEYYGVPQSWEEDNLPETASSTKTQMKGKAQAEGEWYSYTWPQRESATDEETFTSYCLHTMPSTSQSTMDDPGYNVPDPLKYQSYPMPNGLQSTWYNPPSYVEPAASQPSTEDADYYFSASQQTCPGGCSTAERSGDGMTVSCPHPGCTSRPFKRTADLQRHYIRTHSNEPAIVYPCDYHDCFREGEPFRRRDHLRDHLRQYHGEDIKRSGASSAMRSSKITWWRCTRCLARVSVSQHGFKCPRCETVYSVNDAEAHS